jgi:hypothetical protein
MEDVALLLDDKRMTKNDKEPRKSGSRHRLVTSLPVYDVILRVKSRHASEDRAKITKNCETVTDGDKVSADR